jgi:hypothetical protein
MHFHRQNLPRHAHLRRDQTFESCFARAKFFTPFGKGSSNYTKSNQAFFVRGEESYTFTSVASIPIEFAPEAIATIVDTKNDPMGKTGLRPIAGLYCSPCFAFSHQPPATMLVSFLAPPSPKAWPSTYEWDLLC